MVGTIDHPTCGEKWMLVLLTPLALAASFAVFGGLVWWAGTLPWRTTLHYREGATWMLICLWPVYAAAFSIAGWVTRPAPEPGRDNVTIEDVEPPISNLPELPRRMERTGPRSATIGPGLPTGISKRDLEQWIAYVWDTRNETDSGRRVTFSVRWARDLDIDIDDGDVGNVKTWLASAGWIRIKRNEQTEVLPPGWEAFRRITRHGIEVFGE